jgi:hypothetical protein
MESGNKDDLVVPFDLYINKSEGSNMIYERELSFLDRANAITSIRAKLVEENEKKHWELWVKAKGENEPLVLVNTRKSVIRRFLRPETLVNYVTETCPNTSHFVIETQLPRGDGT